MKIRTVVAQFFSVYQRTVGYDEVSLRNFENATKIPTVYLNWTEWAGCICELYSAAWSACAETDNDKLSAVTWTDGLHLSQ